MNEPNAGASPMASTETRAQEIYLEAQQTQHARTDRLFGYLMGLQWLAGIAAAVWLSPRTWAGSTSQIHPHVFAAIFLGGAIALLPVLLAWLRPGRPTTRYTIAAGQMLTSALLIHLTGGGSASRSGGTGAPAPYCRGVLLIASAVIATDHLLRGAVPPAVGIVSDRDLNAARVSTRTLAGKRSQG